jgi:hypothetical protein
MLRTAVPELLKVSGGSSSHRPLCAATRAFRTFVLTRPIGAKRDDPASGLQHLQCVGTLVHNEAERQEHEQHQRDRRCPREGSEIPCSPIRLTRRTSPDLYGARRRIQVPRAHTLRQSVGSLPQMAKSRQFDPSLLQHVSPLGWEHINLTGDYSWHTNKRVAKGGFRPLRNPRTVFSAP